LKDHRDFVYHKKAGTYPYYYRSTDTINCAYLLLGAGTYIYVVDFGVAYGVKTRYGREFPTSRVDSILQTKASRDLKQKPTDDDDVASHGTMVASAALGQQFGVAKGAKLVVVKHLNTMTDSLKAFDMIYQDIVIDRPDRILKSVIVMCAGFTRGDTISNEDWKRNGDAWDDALSPLLRKGIPIVLASGNNRKLSDNMNGLPETLQKQTFPVINVGSVDAKGNRAENSQGGSQLAVHAVGVDVELPMRDGKIDKASGTSFGKFVSFHCSVLQIIAHAMEN
jgi:subtilisin family serine protease